MLKIITPTGGRPKAISLLNKYLERQTDQNFKWIVLDDCEPPTEIPYRCNYLIQAPWKWERESTQAKSLIKLLDVCNYNDKVLICEDDDYYKPDYVSIMREKLNLNDIVGIKDSIYYNVSNRTYREFKSNGHASLCQTAITRRMIQALRDVCDKNDRLIDSKLWKCPNYIPNVKGHLFKSDQVIGIKGMKGRQGIGIGHKMLGQPDPDMQHLKSLIGNDYTFYE